MFDTIFAVLGPLTCLGAIVGVLYAIIALLNRSQRAAEELQKKALARTDELLETFRTTLDATAGAELVAIARKFPTLSGHIYANALHIVTYKMGAVAAKQFALDAGRIAYSANRVDRKPTVYDEQAIANDIAMRVGSEESVKSVSPPAVAITNKVVENVPSLTEIVSTLEDDKASRLFEEARELVREGKKELAISVLRRIIETYPNTTSATKAKKSLGFK